tara:strand:- start:205 stop:492 length:288 start_codon:yes stop_codon:yes gene_type:complete
MDGFRPVLVTTVYKGVFFGYLDLAADETSKVLAISNCRNVIYWSGVCGFLGLATHGPEKGSKIGVMAPRILLHDVTAVVNCTAKSADVFNDWVSE